MSTAGKHQPLQATPFWQVPLNDLIDRLKSGAQGLTSTEAMLRLERGGRNQLQTSSGYPLGRKVFDRLRNPLILVLLFAASISAASGEVASFVIIVVVVLLGIVLDTLQEFHAERAADSLRSSVALRERVLRDGIERVLPSEEIVTGDVVLLSAGDLIPADGLVLEARDFFVNEALLTGEAEPAEKHPPGPEPVPGGVAEAHTAAFMGTSVISGSARLLICATGMDTQLGNISSSLRQAPPPAALQRGTYEFGMLIVRVTGLLTLFVLMANLLLHRPLLESFLFALALAVGLTPELLPMVVSVTLSRGATRMAREQVIVKRLAAIHDLGSMDVLCTDKTGTLTEAKIRLVRQLSLSGQDSPAVLTLAWLNSNFETGLRNPLDTAILDCAPGDTSRWHKLDEVPFDFERRRVSVLVEDGGAPQLVIKGAPEDVLKLSRYYDDTGSAEPRDLDPATRERAAALCESLGREGYRVLGIAWRRLDPGCMHISRGDERDLVFAGFAAFLDPPKKSAHDAIVALQRDGVEVKVVTGDHEAVTRHVCTELGFAISGAMTGDALAALDDEALGARLDGTTLFCRVTPSQKARIIMALKRRGHVVGFLGDGINDAPSLHIADVGISVDGAVDVAKDAADIILLRNDLMVLQRGVREGRRTFGNIMKYVMMGTSSNFGNMFSMAAATLLLPFLPMLPVQILLNNLLYDLSEMPIPMDRVDEESIATPQHWDMRFIRNFMLVLGPVSSVFDFLTFGLLLKVFHAGAALFQTGWFIESLATQVLVIFVIRTRRNPLRSRPGRLLTATSLAVVATAVALPYTFAGRWLGFVAPPPAFLAAVAGMVVCYLLLAELVKRWFYQRMPPRGVAHAAQARPLLPFTAGR